MERIFCTIITRSHMAWALALLDSLRQYDAQLPFAILVTDDDGSVRAKAGAISGVEVLSLTDLAYMPLGLGIAERYAQQSDELRWSMKGVLMEHLLQRYQKVIYGDCDLHFFHDPAWLWKGLETSNMLLTPHWRSSSADVDRGNFDLLFVEGLYNAGFVGASRGALNALRLWAANCLAVCVKDGARGQFVDQTHLNILPIYFEGIQVLKHRGCNVANWNTVECARSIDAQGQVLIAGQWPVVFIHFTRSMIDGIISGEDGTLLPHVTTLRDRLLQNGYAQDIIEASQARIAARTAPPKNTLRTRIGAVVRAVRGKH